MTDAASVRSNSNYSNCSSIRSNGSSKYRRVSSKSSVDESLFGTKKRPSRRPNNVKEKAKISKTERPSPIESPPSITATQLQRIKQSALEPAMRNSNEGSNNNATNSEQREQQDNLDKRAQARKEHMKQLEIEDIERQRKLGTQNDQAKLDRIRQEAQRQIDENADIVKLLQSCSERASTFAIRDLQLKDKAERERREKDYERRMILSMEINRLQELEAREAEDTKRMQKMIDDRKVIERQIEERAEARLLQEEARDQENREMLERIRMYQLQDEEKARKKKEIAERAREEIIRENEAHIAAKRERKLLEKKEDEMMVAYQLEQDEKLRKREAEEAEADRKKREIQKKLLDEQERTMDRRSEMDELRARRAVEDAERKYRQKKLMEAQKKKRDMELLDEARRQQQEERLERQRMEAELKQEEYANAMRHAHSMAERERAEEAYAKKKNAELIRNLQQQIEENKATKAAVNRQKYLEGGRIKQELAEERAKLEGIRDKMVADMKAKGINERYYATNLSFDACVDEMDSTIVAKYLSSRKEKIELTDSETLLEESDSCGDTGLTDNQNRLLYLIDLHTTKATDRDGSDRWIRKQALSVLVYEGVISGVFHYDYAPQSSLIDNRRVWINVSQEGQSDIEFLREGDLINALLVSSKSYKPVVLYQVSDKGQALLQNNMSRREKEAVNLFAHKPESRELLKASWDGECYWLESSSGYKKRSSTTDVEDVSYVSSAYIPQCLRYGGRPTLSNAHRAHECAQAGIDNIRDNDLDEIITLNSVSVIVAEYIPFGCNQIVQLNSNIGSTERVQGGYVSNVIDSDSGETALELSPELTSVEVLDYTETNHINLEASIRFREDPGVVQVETFGVSLNAEGTCFYGMQVEAVLNRIKDNISLDHLSRMLVDAQEDSSSIVDSVISQYQRDLLDLVFIGDAANRNKFNLIIANEITPHLTAGEYMDKGEYENEFKQVIGDTRAAYDITEQDTLIFGSQGLLLCGPSARNYEPLLCAYLQYVTLDLFLQNFFSRVWILNDDLKASYQIVSAIEYDRLALGKSRSRLSSLSNEIISLEQVLGYLEEALHMMSVPPEPPEQEGRSLYKRLELSALKDQLKRRVKDIKKNLTGSQQKLNLLRERVEAESQNSNASLSSELEKNTKQLCALQAANGDTTRTLKTLQTIFAGMIAFDILDRITGDWTVVDATWMSDFVDSVIKKYVLLWFALSILFWVIAAYVVNRRTFLRNWKSRGITSMDITLNRKIDVSKLVDFVAEKEKTMEECRYEQNRQLVKVTYTDPAPAEWGGAAPLVTLEYDDKNGILQSVNIQYNRREARKDSVLSAHELKQKLMHEFASKELFVEEVDDYADFALAIEKRKQLLANPQKAGKAD